MTTPKIYLEHVLGTSDLKYKAETIDELLALNAIPRTIVQPYIEHDGEFSPIPGWTRLDALPEDTNAIVVRAIRNTLFDATLPHQQSPTTIGKGPGISSIHLTGHNATTTQLTLDIDTAKFTITNEVKQFIDEYDVRSRGCVFGVSGGGDSNALAFGLSNALPDSRLTAFTLVFRDVMTPEAADRAAVLCQDLGIEHHIYDEHEISKLLRLKTSTTALYTDFQDAFGNESIHFFGTFLILRAARTISNERKLWDIAFGYNREDLLAELLFTLMNGRAPLALPIRPMGRQRIIMPVWRASKILHDACHPRFSLENYRERDAATTQQRSLAFYLAHSLDSIYPGFGMSLLSGAKDVFKTTFSHLTYDEDLDTFVTQYATQKQIDRVHRVLSRHLPDSAS